MSELRLVLAFVAIAGLLGCTVGPEFVPPRVPVQTSYTTADPSAVPGEPGHPPQRIEKANVPPERWWHAFGSLELDDLVERSLAASPTMESARATLSQAEHVLDAARGTAHPRLTLAASAQRSNGAVSKTADSAGNLISIGPTLDYTPDVFGATRRRIEQAQSLLDYQQAQWRAAKLTLAGNTVLQAIALAAVNEQIDASREIISVDERNLELARISATAGKSAQLDVLTAQSQLSSDHALLPPLLQQASVARHALAVLAGETSASWEPPEFDLDAFTLPQELPLSIPSELVRLRPDITAAQAQLHAASATIGIATAQLYPSITLTSNWVTSASTAGGLFGSSNLWNLAANLLAPIFDGHTLAAERDAAIDAYSAQLGVYQQTLLQAFGQVADVLESLQHDASLLDAQHRALEAARATLNLTQQSYQAGQASQASLLQLLVSQRLYQEARRGYARARGQRYADSAQFFVAMGG